MKRIALYAAAAALMFPLAANAASPQKPGKWQITTQMEMTGMPVKIPPTTLDVCVTKEDTENPEKMVPKGTRDNKANCKVADYKIDGNSVSWKMTCEGEHPVSGSGKLIFNGDEYDGSMDMKVDDREMHMKYKGKRLGECDGTEMNAKKK